MQNDRNDRSDIMTLPANYDPTPLAPQIEIKRKGVRILLWQHPQISDEPRQDFNLESYSFRTGINTDAGNATLSIPDHENEFIHHGISPIQPADEIIISMGKTADNISEWYGGEVKEIRIIDGGYNKQKLELTSIGYANGLAYRFADFDMEWPDFETNPDSQVSEIARHVMQGENLFIQESLGLSGLDIGNVDVRLTHYQHHNRSVKSIIADLAKLGNATYGITPDKRFYFHGKESSDFKIGKIDQEADAYQQNVAYANHHSQVTDGFGRHLTFGVTSQNTVYDANYLDGFSNLQYFGLPVVSENTHSVSVRCRPTSKSNIQIFTDTKIYKTVSKILNPPTRTNSSLRSVANSAEDELELNPSSFSPPAETFAGLATHVFSPHSTYYLWLTIPFPTEWREFYDSEKNYVLGLENRHNLFFGRDPTGRLPIMKITEMNDTMLISHNVYGGKKEQIENANNQDLSTATLQAERYLYESHKGRRVYDPITISPPSRVPPTGYRVTLPDNSTPVLAGYNVSGNMSQRLIAHRIQLNLAEAT